MNVDWKEIKNSIVASVESRAKDFLDKAAGSREFVHERAERLARQAADYALETDAAKRAHLIEMMEVVRSTMELEIAIVLANAQIEGRNFLKSLLGTAMDIVIKVLPGLIPI